MTDYTIRRDFNDRPLVMPPDAGPLTGEWREGKDRKGKPKTWWYSKDAIGYTRASSAGAGLKDGGGLVDWAACQSAVGMVLDTAARSQVVTLVNQYKGDPWNKGDDGTAHSGKDRLKEAVDQARSTAGQHVASSAGTEFHGYVELINQGITPTVIQDEYVQMVADYQSAVRGVKFLLNEFFFINDELQLAGSSDALIELPAGLTTPDGVTHDEPIVCASDLKTGKWDARYPLGVTCQVAAAGTGVLYDQENNVRTPIHPLLNADWGVMFHQPIMGKRPVCTMYWLDLRLGLRAAKLARDADAMRKEFESKKNSLKELVIA